MADRKSSALNQASSLVTTQRVLMYDPNEGTAANQNKTAPISLFDARYLKVFTPIRSNATSLTISTIANYTFYGDPGNATWTLPTGSSSYYQPMILANVGTTSQITVNRAGSDTIAVGTGSTSTTFKIYPGQKYQIYWDGVTWVVL